MTVNSERWQNGAIVGNRIRILIAIVTLPVWWLMLAWFKCVGRNCEQPWIISGHRGRLKADNAGVLMDHISIETTQPILWIASDVDGQDALPRNSWQARIAIARAPVLIYSHGEDDLDILLALCRPLLGFRVCLGHGANLVKRGSMHPAVVQRKSKPRRFMSDITTTDYDILLCQSVLEKKFWDANCQSKAERHVVVGGSARLDPLLESVQRNPEQRIVWFPTFRDSDAGQRALIDTVKDVCAHPGLGRFLAEHRYALDIGIHVNNDPDWFKLVDAEPNISLFQSDELLDRLTRAELLITDYSSVMIDWLLFDRPAVFFPFDLANYQTTRGFHLPYETYVYGPRADALDQLVEVLTKGAWRDRAREQDCRAKLRELFFGTVKSGNAALCYLTIKSRCDGIRCDGQ